MRVQIRRPFRAICVVVSALLIATVASGAGAAGPSDNPAGPAVRRAPGAGVRRAPVPPAPVGLLAVRSLDDAAAFARALGNEPAPFLSTRFLESKLGFLSPGDVMS